MKIQTQIQQDSLPKVKAPFRTILNQLIIVLGSLNIGYVLTYLTQTIDTLFANLHIEAEEKTSKLSLVNGILPGGCFLGVLIAFFLKKKLSNKTCIFIADGFGLLNLLTLIADYEVIVAFRFFLGVANGISSLMMPVYLKSLCPERYFIRISLFMGYWAILGVLLGQTMGAGYISYHGEGTSWWRVVFIVPSVICAIRSLTIRFMFNYDSPEQLIERGRIDEAKYVIKSIYQEQYWEQVFQHYSLQAQLSTQDNLRFMDIFSRKKLVTLQVGILAMFIQTWCGSSAIFYYSSQIFEKIAGGDQTQKTIYQICIGLFSVFAQFSTLYFIRTLGSKYLLILGSVVMGLDNIAIGFLSQYSNPQVLFSIFILMVLLIGLFSCTIGPISWSIVPQVNDSNATFFSMECRWAFQAILVFIFPFMIKGLGIDGSFFLFGGLNFAYALYCVFCVIDSRGMTNAQLVEKYHTKYNVLPQDPNQQKI